MILQLALRNVWRHRRRTLLTALGLAAALAMMMVTEAVNAGSWASTVAAAIRGTAGHLVVQHPDFQADRRATDAVEGSGRIAQRLREAYPGATITRRVWLGGLLTSPRNSASIGLQGVEPDAEAAVGTLDERLVAGAWLAAPGQVVIGDGVAERLKVSVGDKVVFMVQVGDGEMQSLLLRVGGISHAGTERLDDFGAVARLSDVAPLLPGDDPAHQIAVVGDGDLPRGPAEAAAGGAAVLDWRQALPVLQEQGDLKGAFSRLLNAFMAVIVGVGITNTVLMSVMERIREFGVLRAVGLRPRALFGLVALEGLLVGVLGALGACSVSIPAIVWLRDHGLDLGDAMGASGPVAEVPVDTVLRAVLDPSSLASFALAAVFVAVAASLWPAFKAATLRPIDALHHH